jgi:hypothetical protein
MKIKKSATRIDIDDAGRKIAIEADPATLDALVVALESKGMCVIPPPQAAVGNAGRRLTTIENAGRLFGDDDDILPPTPPLYPEHAQQQRSASGPVGNDDDDILVRPTIDWAEVAAENRQTRAK